MSTDQGASAKADRAATPSEPSQSSVVSGVAGIPWAFTPGPWSAKDAYRGQGFWVMREERGQGWVRGKRLDTPAGEFDEADAHLIAAAPELYDAGAAILAALEGQTLGIGSKEAMNSVALALSGVQAALAKARGQ